MSWSVSTIVKASTLDADLAALVIPYHHNTECDDQLATVKSHVKSVITSLPRSDYYFLTLSGHATPGHVVDGSNQESITLSMTTATADSYVRHLEAQKKALEDEIVRLSPVARAVEIAVDMPADEVEESQTFSSPELEAQS